MVDALGLFSPGALAFVRGETHTPEARVLFERERDTLLDELADGLHDDTREAHMLPHTLSDGRAIFYVERRFDEIRRTSGHQCYSGFSFALDARHGDFGFHSFVWFLLPEPDLERIGAPVGSGVMNDVLEPDGPEVTTFHQEGCVFLHIDAIPLEPRDGQGARPFSRDTLVAAVRALPRWFDLADARLVERYLRWYDA